MTLRLPNRRTLHRNVIHSLEIHRLVEVRRQVVVRTWRRTEEAAELSFGRVERRTTLPLRLGRSCATDVLHQYQRTSFSSPRANFPFLSSLPLKLFCPSFRAHALKTVLNTMTHPRASRIHIVGLFFKGANSCRMNDEHHSHCTHVWCSYHTNVYVSAMQCER